MSAERKYRAVRNGKAMQLYGASIDEVAGDVARFVALEGAEFVVAAESAERERDRLSETMEKIATLGDAYDRSSWDVGAMARAALKGGKCPDAAGPGETRRYRAWFDGRRRGFVAVLVTLTLALAGCVSDVTPFVRSVRATPGALDVERCELQQNSMTGPEVDPASCKVTRFPTGAP